MINRIWQLQLFADAGDGAAAAPTGADGADAGHQKLVELGVPEGKIRSNRDYTSQSGQQPSGRMTWDQVKKDPEYSAEISKIVQQRLKDAGAAQQAMDTLSPWLRQLAQQQGMDPDRIDYAALAQSFQKEPPISPAQQRLDAHMRILQQQGEALKAAFPGFDLRRELGNETFARLVSPQMGMSVEDAYHAVHRKEIQAAAMQVAAQKTAQQISNAIRSGSLRPDETGVNPRSPSLTTFDYTKMSKAERQALKKRIYRGERILPGQI